MISKLSTIFTSKTKAQEIVLLLHNAKEVIRQGFYEQELPAVEEFCMKDSLCMVKSRFKVLLADENHFTNKGLRLAEDDPRLGIYFVYISKDESKAWLASYYELMGNHRDLGLLLGYPACCVEFFAAQFTAGNVNPQHLPLNPYTNLTQREKDAVLLSHFPCSSHCEQSIELAKKYLNLLAKVDTQRAVELMEELHVY